MPKTYDSVNIDAERLRNDIARKRFSLVCVSVNVGREESWLAKRLKNNTIRRESLINVCKLCGLKAVDYIIDTPADIIDTTRAEIERLRMENAQLRDKNDILCKENFKLRSALQSFDVEFMNCTRLVNSTRPGYYSLIYDESGDDNA